MKRCMSYKWVRRINNKKEDKAISIKMNEFAHLIK